MILKVALGGGLYVEIFDSRVSLVYFPHVYTCRTPAFL